MNLVTLRVTLSCRSSVNLRSQAVGPLLVDNCLLRVKSSGLRLNDSRRSLYYDLLALRSLDDLLPCVLLWLLLMNYCRAWLSLRLNGVLNLSTLLMSLMLLNVSLLLLSSGSALYNDDGLMSLRLLSRRNEALHLRLTLNPRCLALNDCGYLSLDSWLNDFDAVLLVLLRLLSDLLLLNYALGNSGLTLRDLHASNDFDFLALNDLRMLDDGASWQTLLLNCANVLLNLLVLSLLLLLLLLLSLWLLSVDHLDVVLLLWILRIDYDLLAGSARLDCAKPRQVIMVLLVLLLSLLMNLHCVCMLLLLLLMLLVNLLLSLLLVNLLLTLLLLNQMLLLHLLLIQNTNASQCSSHILHSLATALSRNDQIAHTADSSKCHAWSRSDHPWQV